MIPVADINVTEVMEAVELPEKYEDMGLRVRLLHDSEMNTDRGQPNRHAVVVGENAIVFETE